MLPLSSKKLIGHVAKTQGIPEEHMKHLIEFYYDTIRNKISSMEDPRIVVHGLGTFVFKGWKAQEYIERYQAKRDFPRMRGNGEIIRNFYQTKIDKITSINEKYQTEKQRKYDYKKAKYAKQDTNHLEEPEQNF